MNLDDLWPQERDFMERPDRIKYVRKLIKPKGCVFCAASEKRPSKSSLLLYKDDLVMAMLNKYPYNNGHLLLLPRKHIGNLLDLDSETYEALSRLVRESLNIVNEAYGKIDCNIGINHGRVAGAGIPDHLHWHLIPRWLGDTNFFPLIGQTKVVAEPLNQTYDRLRPFFKEITL